MALQATRTPRIIVGPPLAGGLLWWPAPVACSGGLLRWPALAVCSGGLLWRATAGGGQRRVACSGGLRRVVGLSAAPAFLCYSISVICTLATNNTPVSGGFVVRSACK